MSHFDAPSWTNGGGVIVLPLALLLGAAAIMIYVHDWRRYW